ncbi:TonB-dependent hemoglobin/transferrin/lactoferrin family receptor [Benzoatithermus flavus]|uniref:TonB-dependent hemoglobin/transferrin/lactoferrin family receptor n=1 Tax=Benzoatithermus flavus TaxID=3108223 RepID=A0ABU8XTV1_9PROT
MTGRTIAMRRSHGLLVAAAAAMAGAGAAAQEQAGGTGATSPDGAVLDPITVTATSNPLESFEYPGQVSVVGRRQIESLNPSKPADVLRYVPGVAFEGGPRRTGEVPSIRGFSGPDVTVLFDGTRQSFHSGHDGRLFIDPDLTKRVEVVRGPTSALYGSGGLGGTIEFRTVDAADFLRAGETAGTRFRTGYATADKERQFQATGFAQAQGTDLVGSLSLRDSASIELGDGSRLHDAGQETFAGLLKGSYTGVRNHRFELSYLGFRGEAEEPNNPQGLGSGGLTDKDIRNDTLRAGWRWSSPDRPWLDLGLTAYYAGTEVEERPLDDTGLSPEGARLTRKVDTVGMRADNRTRLDHGGGTSSLFTYGVEAYRDDQDGRSSVTADNERAGVPDAEATTTALFLQDELVLDRPLGTPGTWLVIPGLRYDHFSNASPFGEDTDDGKLSPKLGVTWLPVEWLSLFGTYAQAFRAPTFDELYANGLHFSIPRFGDNFFVANTDLKPQETTNYEIGAGLKLENVAFEGDKVQVKGSYFWIKGKDFIDLEVVQPTPPSCFPPNCDGTTRAVNVADAELQGAEIEAAYENRRILAALGYAQLDGEDENTGRPLGVLQPNRLTAQLAVKLPEIDVVAGWRGIFAGRLDRADPGEERDAYRVHGLFATWEPAEGPLEGVRLDLGVDNLFDETYAQVFTGAVEEGRDFKAAISYTLRW